MKPILIALCVLSFFAAPVEAASGTRVVNHAMTDFLDGELDGLGVGPTGELIAAPVSLQRFFTPSLYVWCMGLDREGRLLAGVGDNGGVVRQDGDEFAEIARFEDQLVMAVVDTPDGVLAGTGPEGRVFRLDEEGPVAVLEVEATTVWTLAPADNGRSWLAGVGPDAAVIRFDPGRSGQGEVVTAVQAAVVRHLVRDEGRLWMATQGPSMIVRSDSDPDRPERIRHDAGDLEIPAILPDGEGGLWFLELDPGDPDQLEPPSTTLLRLPAEGSAERIWAGEIALMSLARTREGDLLAGEIGASRVHRITPDGRIGLWRDFGDGDASALLVDGDVTWVGSSNLGDIFRLAAPENGRGTFTSRPVATPAVERWGRLWVDGDGGKVRFSTRSGVRREPDESWSEWSRWQESGERIEAPLADWVQYRITIEKAEVIGVHLAWARRNHAPRIRGIFFEGNAPADFDWSETESNGYGEPSRERSQGAAVLRGRSQVRVDAVDIDGDELSITVELQRDGKGSWYPLSREKAALRVDWDTTQFEDGTWRARVKGHDPDGATLVTLVSPPVKVDNRAPVLDDFRRDDDMARLKIVDRGSRLAKVELRIAGTERFRRIEPVDGVVDGESEEFEIALDAGIDALWIRATDVAGNEAVFTPRLSD